MSRLGFDVAGEGPTALLVHGFTGSRDAWGVELVEALARDLRVVRVDLPGHGASPAWTRPAHYQLDRVLAELVAVLDRIGAERPLWIGYSLGGRISLGAAALCPERVAALVLEGASPGLAEPAERAARTRDDEAITVRLERNGIEAFVDYWMGLPLFASQRRLGPERLARERERRLRNSPAALAACLRGLGTGAQPSFWQALPGLRVPALLLAGEGDLKFRAICERMAEAMPRAETRVIPGCGHATHLENPEAWLAAIRHFAARLGCMEGERA
ncbi:MAG: 2-succinyl-6-hydroxy-2,4-cyclohexadiene-1-carboxylate synthase [Myxococcota bacterium]